MTLDGFELSPHVKNEISFLIKGRRLPHAVIVCGGNQDERLSFARFLSAAKLCTDDRNIPCLECRDCRKIFGGIHPDVSVYSREKDKKEFSVKIVRDLIKPEAFVKPNEAEGRVCIISDAHTMNASAQNAFLKILEEPPKDVSFILCADVSSSMLETIRSRATVYTLVSRIESDEKQDEAIEIADSLVCALMLPEEFTFMSKTGVFEKDKELLACVLEKMQIIFRDALILKNGGEALSGKKQTAEKLSDYLSTQSIIMLIDKTNELYNSINKNANLNLLITRLSSSLRQITRR